MLLFAISVSFVLLTVIASRLVTKNDNQPDRNPIRLPRLTYSEWLEKKGLGSESLLPGFKLLRIPNELATRDPRISGDLVEPTEYDYAYVEDTAPAYLFGDAVPVPPTYRKYGILEGLILGVGVLTPTIAIFLALFAFNVELSTLEVAAVTPVVLASGALMGLIENRYQADVRKWADERIEFLKELEGTKSLIFIQDTTAQHRRVSEWAVKLRVAPPVNVSNELTTPGDLVTEPQYGKSLDLFAIVQDASELNSIEVLTEAGAALSAALIVHHEHQSRLAKQEEARELINEVETEGIDGGHQVTQVLEELTREDSRVKQELHLRASRLKGDIKKMRKDSEQMELESHRSELRERLQSFIVHNASGS